MTKAKQKDVCGQILNAFIGKKIGKTVYFANFSVKSSPNFPYPLDKSKKVCYYI